ncbi:diguanylate cyclase [Thermodesulfobacteriota bacterium]
MQYARETRTYKVYTISITLVILLVFSGIFLGMSLRTRRLIFEENLNRGRALFASIVLTRKWNAGYGGVYVEKKEGVASNPYLDKPDITTIHGKVYTKRNPSLMTREISEYAEKEGAFSFHLTSLRPLNPDNSPDAFERRALQEFEQGKPEIFCLVKKDTTKLFRYMAPLVTEVACLQCHSAQGYRAGDIRGGISVAFDVAQVQQKLRANMILIVVSGLSTTALMLGLFYFLTLRLIKDIRAAREQLERISVTDMLTGLFNRRYVIERFENEFARTRRTGVPLSCIMIDIDRFKAINDTQGHLVGDAVLKEVAQRLQRSIRKYDVVGRYGGEEFLVVLPDAGINQAKAVAGRMHGLVKDSLAVGIAVTVSLGIAMQREDDQGINALISRADDAMYRAKDRGRDRIEVADNPAT